MSPSHHLLHLLREEVPAKVKQEATLHLKAQKSEYIIHTRTWHMSVSSILHGWSTYCGDYISQCGKSIPAVVSRPQLSTASHPSHI